MADASAPLQHLPATLLDTCNASSKQQQQKLHRTTTIATIFNVTYSQMQQPVVRKILRPGSVLENFSFFYILNVAPLFPIFSVR